MEQSQEKPQRVTKSVRLRKYQMAYDLCVKKSLIVPNQSSKSSRPPRSAKPKTRSPKEKVKKRLNPYQLFVKKESNKSTYEGLSSKERMKVIGALWRDKNYLTKRRKPT